MANASTIYANAYGWGDEQCSHNFTSICETMREWLDAPLQLRVSVVNGVK